MKDKKLLTLVGGICVVLMLATVPFMAACAKPTPTGPIVLKGVTFLPSLGRECQAFKMFVDRVNEKAGGELVIEWIGGPEIVPPFDLAEAASGGVVDVAWCTPAFYDGVVPGVGILEASHYTPQEERERGAYDFMLERHKMANLFYLGRGLYGPEFAYIWTNKRASNPSELKGQKLGDGTMAVRFLKHVGVAPTFIGPPDIYSGLDKGVIDGVVWPVHGWTDWGWHEVIKYVIDVEFFCTDVTLMVNLDRWNALPEHLQNVMKEVTLTIERDTPALLAKICAEDWAIIEAAGIEKIKFSPADTQWMVDTIYQLEFEEFIERYPDIGPKLKELFSK